MKQDEEKHTLNRTIYTLQTQNTAAAASLFALNKSITYHVVPITIYCCSVGHLISR